MFYCYVLRSQKTGRRYVGSCENLLHRLYRHNAGQMKATKHGAPWSLLHGESFATRREAVQRELYYKTGRGRDDLDRLELERSPRRQVAGSNPVTPIKLMERSLRRRVAVSATVSETMVRFFLIAVAMRIATTSLFAQAAVSSSTNPQESPAPQISPAPPQNEGPAPRIPAIEELDQAFKQTSLGKAVDEAHLHAQWRELSNRIINDRDLVEARARAGKAKTDLEKRQRLRAYYTTFYDRMRSEAGSQELKSYIDTHKTQHLALLAQNRVRPSPAPAATASPKPKPRPHPPEPPLPQ